MRLHFVVFVCILLRSGISGEQASLDSCRYTGCTVPWNAPSNASQTRDKQLQSTTGTTTTLSTSTTESRPPTDACRGTCTSHEKCCGGRYWQGHGGCCPRSDKCCRPFCCSSDATCYQVSENEGQCCRDGYCNGACGCGITTATLVVIISTITMFSILTGVIVGCAVRQHRRRLQWLRLGLSANTWDHTPDDEVPRRRVFPPGFQQLLRATRAGELIYDPHSIKHGFNPYIAHPLPSNSEFTEELIFPPLIPKSAAEPMTPEEEGEQQVLPGEVRTAEENQEPTANNLTPAVTVGLSQTSNDNSAVMIQPIVFSRVGEALESQTPAQMESGGIDS